MNKKDQSASGTAVEPVTDGQSDTLVSVVKNYPGGKDKLELARANPNFRKEIWETLDRLASKQALRLPIIERPAWKTIRLGTGLKTADDFVQAIKAAGGKVGDYARDILGKPAFTASNQPTEIDLIIVTVSELGFPKGATRKEIYAKAQSLGLSLCPPEVGPQLRLQYMDQPNNEYLLIGMEPIAGSHGALSVFLVAHDGHGPWLYSHSDYPDDVWLDNDRWVFVRGK